MRMRLAALLIALSACDCGGRPETAPELTIAPAKLDFGVVRAGVTVRKSVRVENVGDAAVTLEPPVITNDSRGAYTVGALAASLDPGTWTTLEVTYVAPATPGADTATLAVRGDGASASVELTATSREACPGGAVESACGNGLDDDCDGFPDCRDPDCATDATCAEDTCATLGDPVRLSPADEDGSGAVAAWTGDRFGTVWLGYTPTRQHLEYTSFDGAGRIVDGSTRVTANDLRAPQRLFSMPWNGSAFGLAFGDPRSGENEVWFQRIDSGGVRTSAAVQLSESPGSAYPASAAWNPDANEWAVFWGNQGDEGAGATSVELSFRAVRSSGTPRGTEQRVTTTGEVVGESSAAWSSGRFGVAWRNRAGSGVPTKFARVSADGVLEGDVIALGPEGSGSAPSVVALEDGWAVVHAEPESQRVVLTRIGATGAVGESIVLATFAAGSPVAVAAARSGSAVGVAWTEAVNERVELGFRTFALSDGAPIADRAFVHCVGSGAMEPFVASGGGRWAVLFTARHNARTSSYVKLFGG